MIKKWILNVTVGTVILFSGINIYAEDKDENGYNLNLDPEVVKNNIKAHTSVTEISGKTLFSTSYEIETRKNHHNKIKYYENVYDGIFMQQDLNIDANYLNTQLFKKPSVFEQSILNDNADNSSWKMMVIAITVIGSLTVFSIYIKLKLWKGRLNADNYYNKL